jgi:CRISPR system Cascade subunit CasE
VLSAFPDLIGNADARQHFGVLHRLDVSRNGTPILLVQSMEKPEWSRLSTEYLLEDSSIENPACKRIDEQYGHIAAGDVFAFRLRANPTKKTGTTKKSDIAAGKQKDNGTRVPLHGEDAQIKWLMRKSLDGGFELLQVKISSRLADPEAYRQHGPLSDATINDEGLWRSKSLKGHQKDDAGKINDLSLASVLFEGRLRITDKDRFLETIKKGIGPGKAYGFGLLSIARAA